MSVLELASRLSSITLGTLRSHSCIVRQPLSGLYSKRCLSISGALQRNLDSHAIPPYMLPSNSRGRWQVLKSFRERYEYTIKPLPFPKTGGRGPNGRIWNHRRGGGNKRNYRMIDWVRAGENSAAGGSTADPLIEKIEGIKYDPNRSARIALVATNERKRYIIATHNMEKGMLIQSTLNITRSPVKPVDGNSYPLGSLPIGTLVSCVEKTPGSGGMFARAAGVTAVLLRKQGDECTIRLPSKREMIVSAACTATVGQVSNVNHNRRRIGKAGRNRWLGIRPKSGRWHRKTGYHGRKIRPPKPALVYSQSAEVAADGEDSGGHKKEKVRIRDLEKMFPRCSTPWLLRNYGYRIV